MALLFVGGVMNLAWVAALTLSDSYGQFAYLHLNSHGVVRA